MAIGTGQVGKRAQNFVVLFCPSTYNTKKGRTSFEALPFDISII